MTKDSATLEMKYILMNIICMLLIFTHFHSWSQQFETELNNLVPEKIYLQLDSKVYASDKIIWFKSVVTNAIDHTPTSISGVLYVELINPNERVLEKKLIKLDMIIYNIKMYLY